MRSRGKRSGYTTAGGGGGSGETVNAQMWRFDGGSGSVKVSAGIPLKPGALFAANMTKLIVKVSGTEQAIAVSALKGTFPDGSLRSVGVQTVQSLTDGSPVDCTIEIGGATRVTANDIAWQEPVMGNGGTGATTAAMKNKAVIAVMDSQYLCDTFVALVPLKPEASETADTMATFLQTGTGTSQTLGTYYDWALTNFPDSSFGDVTRYGHGHGAHAAYIRANTNAKKRTYYQQAYRLLVASCGGDEAGGRCRIGTAAGVSTNVYDTSFDSTLAAAASTSDSAIFSEEYTGLFWDWATGYLLSAWSQPWRWVCHKVCAEGQLASNTYATVRDAHMAWNPRFNATRRRLPLYLAYVIDATMNVTGAFAPSGRDNNTYHMSTQLPWTIDAYEDKQFTTANFAAYIDGVVCQDPTFSDGAGAGYFPVFMLAKATVPVLIFYYQNIHNDSRIPTFITKIADFMLAQMYYNSGADYYASTYIHKATPVVSGDIGDNDWFLPAMYAPVFAFAYAHTGTSSYRTAALNCARTQQLSDPPGPNGGFAPRVKAVGEYFDAFVQSAKFYVDGGSTRPVSGAHPTALADRPTYTSY